MRSCAPRTVLSAAIVAAITTTTILAAPLPPPDQKADAQMKAVLEQLVALKPKPIEKLTPAEARKQPGPPDAVKELLKKKNGGTLPPPEPVASVKETTVPGPAGAIPVRVYTPKGTGPFPVLVYAHGGGWVIAGVQAYDSSCRALANAAKCVVISVGYRMAPEHRFPAAHEDVYAATQYVMKNAAQFGGDPKKVAIGGESAGGNMATAVCLMARDRKGMMPVHQLLVYPVTDTNPNTPSFKANATAIPLNKPMMLWFLKYTLANASQKDSKYLAVLRNPSLKGLPPATVITAEIDPLMSEGQAYANRLVASGVTTRYKHYTGVTHEFFGMGAVVDKAKEAVSFAAAGLQKSFTK
jgi:acetyl esterase